MNNQNKGKKVLMIGPFPDPITGMSLANKMLLNGLRRDGHKVDIIDSDTEKKLTSLNAQGKFKLKKVLNSIKPIVKGCYKIIFGNYDVIYITPAQSYLGFMKFTPFINMAMIRKVKCYLHFHGGFVRQMYDSVSSKKQLKLKKYFERSNGIIVLGHSLKYMFTDILDESKVFVCENGIENSMIISKDELKNKIENVNFDKKIEVLYLSNLMKTKGIIELLQSFIRFKNDNINIHLDLAGSIETDIEEEVKGLLKELGEYVTYHGVVKGETKKNLLKKDSVFCLPTYYPNEGQPISILEAMGNGLAIVTTDQGGIKDIFKNGVNGEYCLKEDEKSIYKAILRVTEKYNIYALNNYEECINYYTENKFTQRVQEIIFK